MNYYHATFIEQSGEQEYSYDYLVEAETLLSAQAILHNFLKDWYFDFDGMTDGFYEFNNGTQVVRGVTLVETTKEAFIGKMLTLFTVKY